MRCARSSPTRCSSSVELTRSVKRRVTGAFKDGTPPSIGTAPHSTSLRRAPARGGGRECEGFFHHEGHEEHEENTRQLILGDPFARQFVRRVPLARLRGLRVLRG